MSHVNLKEMSDLSMTSGDIDIEFANSSGDDDDDDDDNLWEKKQFFQPRKPFGMRHLKTLPTSPAVMPSSFPEKKTNSSMLRPASRSGISIPRTGRPSISQSSSALNQASALLQKFQQRGSVVETRPKSAMRISFNIESDEDSKRDRSNKEHPNDSDSEKRYLKCRQRFLKKPKPEEPAKIKESNKEPCVTPKPGKPADAVLKKQHSMPSTSIVLSTDDESMAEFIGKLSLPDNPPLKKDPVPQPPGRLSRNSSMERRPSILKRSPSPRQIHSPSSSLRNQSSRSPSPAFAVRTVKHLHSVTEDVTLAESLPAEIVEEEEEESEGRLEVREDEVNQSRSTGGDSKVHLFSVEESRPSFQESKTKNKTEKTKEIPEKSHGNKSHHSKSSRHSSKHSSRHSSKHSSRHSSKHSSRNSSDKSITEEIHSKDHNIFAAFGLHTVDDLLPPSHHLPGQHRSVSFDTGSIKVTSSHKEESVSEVVSDIHTQRSITISNRKHHSSHSSVTDVYTEDFVSTNVSGSDQNVYTEDFHSDSEMETANLSSDAFISETGSANHSKDTVRSRKSRVKTPSRSTPKVIRVCNEGTQTNEIDFIQDQLQASPWNSLYANQDWRGRPLITGSTKPAASARPHVCGHTCLNAHLPSHSNLTAVHEIMKQQVEFTRQFCESQKFLYHSLVDALTPDYVYTTLADTKEYIKRHRKPKLTMKKALKMVELEMQTS